MKCQCGKRMKCLETRHTRFGTRRRYHCTCQTKTTTTYETLEHEAIADAQHGATVTAALALIKQATFMLEKP